MYAKEIRDMETNVIVDQIEAKREELFRKRLDFAANKLEDSNELRKVRKDLARMLTVLRERQLAAEFVAETEPEEAEEAVETAVPTVEPVVPAEAQQEVQQVEAVKTEGEADNA